jgi:hypothetical protein
MGYTHYFIRPRKNAGSAFMFGKLALDAKKIIEQATAQGIAVSGPLGHGTPEFTESHFSLNGLEMLGQDHETFYWSGIPEIQEWRKDEPDHFSFCKTAYKPYDAVVTAILIRAKVIYGSCVSISSDGDWHEWQAGRDMYETVFGENAPCPFARESV